MSFDVERARARFPALHQDWVLMDNAGGAAVLDSVIERMSEYMRSTPVQIGASYDLSRLAVSRLEQATVETATLINAAPGEIVFGPSSSALLSRLARAIASQLEPGDEIIVSQADHEANITPWQRLAERGVTIRTWPVDAAAGRLDMRVLDELLNAKTRLVCMGHTSNIFGAVEPVAEVARRVHVASARLVVDGVAWAPHRLVDVQACDADFYVFSAYKVFGPHLGVLYGKSDELLKLDNLNLAFLDRDAVPYKLQPGGYSYEAAYGFGAVLGYLLEQAPSGATPREKLAAAWALMSAHESRLVKKLLDYLHSRPDITIHGPQDAAVESRLPIVSFGVAGKDSADIVNSVDAARIGIRYGHFHARRLIEHLGLLPQNGVVRVSMAHYNTPEEVERLITTLDTAL
ncbi:MAG: cysteine desulfurase-like protein, partial [Gammaproteobacteria bacterium]